MTRPEQPQDEVPSAAARCLFVVARPFAALGVLTAALFVSTPAFALTLSLSEPGPTEVGSGTEFSAEVTDFVGVAEIRWDFGDGEGTEFAEGATAVTHTYSTPGHYPVIVVARDDNGFQSFSFVHTVHTPLTAQKPQSSLPLVYDETHGTVVSVNTDNDTITFVNATTFEKLAEIEVYDGPVAVSVAPDGMIWVVHQSDYAIAVIDPNSLTIVATFRLPYASQPMGVVFAPNGDAILPLLATGEVVRIDSATGQILAKKYIAPFLRGISLSGDGAALWVTRFISPDGHGEVYHLNPETLDVLTRYDLAEDTTTEDSDVQGRGLPNYLFSVALSPDGTEAWIPGKKDNMARGIQRDGLALTQDNTVRPIIAILDLETEAEIVADRIDLDDRNLPRQVTFSPLGDYAFITIFGSNQVEVWDAYDRELVTGMRGGKGPVATILSPDEKLFVLGELSRSLDVYDMSDVLSGADPTTRLLAEIPLVQNEALPANVLLGKQLFSNADDLRMASEGYLSCATCHLDGFEDGRVWEFLDRGEGLRNTTSLLGRRGTGHGPVHWSGNFDEIQDFEGAIRSGQGGIGFLTDEQFMAHSEPLGTPKAGLNPELDAIAEYVAFLDKIPRSPFRNADGSMTEDALLGEEIFFNLGCDFCHSGDDFTDSTLGLLHDVGTLTPESGSRLGEILEGIDTPTLLGIWQTAPYLHDGSAPTLLDVLTTRNPDGLHGNTGALSEAELNQLVAYMQELDQGLPPNDLGVGGTGPIGMGGAGTGGGSGGSETGGQPPMNEESPPPEDGGATEPSGCSCDLSGNRGQESPRAAVWLTMLILALVTRRRRLWL